MRLRSNGDINATIIPTQPIKANEKRKLDISAIYPIIGGNKRNPKNPIVETIAIAMPDGNLRERPAKL